MARATDRALAAAGLLTTSFSPLVMATVHPSSILRAPDDRREGELERFVADLRHLAEALRAGSARQPEPSAAP